MKNDLSDFGKQLAKHVTECAVLQKRVMYIGIFIAGWVVAHSPEVGRLAMAAFKAVIVVVP